ncbi:MAG: PEGA domain-containing protein, partial [Candidatus Sulfotelmatobacter sp.]
VDVVTDQTKADYALKAAPVQIKSESTGGKVARCLFASCIGIEDKGNVSVQFIDTSSSKMLWAYSVNKQKGGSKNEQSMAEAIAKHLKDFVESKSGQEILAARASEPAIAQPEPSTAAAADNSQADPALPLASINVKSTPPGCDINVDGKYMGSTPSTVQLTPGDHVVSIEKENLTPWQRTMTVTAGGSSTIDATLVKP